MENEAEAPSVLWPAPAPAGHERADLPLPTPAIILRSPTFIDILYFRALRQEVNIGVVCRRLIDHTVVQFSCMDWLLGRTAPAC